MTRDRRIPGMRPVQREARELLRHALQRPRPPMYRGRPRWVAEGDFGGGGGGDDGGDDFTPVPGSEWTFGAPGFYMGGEGSSENGTVEIAWGTFGGEQFPGVGNSSTVPIPLEDENFSTGPELGLHPTGYVVAPDPIGPLVVAGSARVFWRGGGDVFGTGIIETEFHLGVTTGWLEPPITWLALSTPPVTEDNWVHPEDPGDTFVAGESYVDIAFSGLTVNGGGFPGGRPIALRLEAFQETPASPESWVAFTVQSASLTVEGA